VTCLASINNSRSVIFLSPRRCRFSYFQTCTTGSFDTGIRIPPVARSYRPHTWKECLYKATAFQSTNTGLRFHHEQATVTSLLVLIKHYPTGRRCHHYFLRRTCHRFDGVAMLIQSAKVDIKSCDGIQRPKPKTRFDDSNANTTLLIAVFLYG